MHILWLQLFYVLAIFTVGVIGGRAPGRKSGSKGGDTTMALGEAFSGGVFLGAGLLHLLPDSAYNFSKFAGGIDFPFASLIAGIGLLLIFLFDQAARKRPADGDAATRPDQAPILLFLVLSIHSIIAGAALGLEEAGVASMAIFVAILAHKGSAGFALGVALVNGGVNEARRNRTILLFAVMTPLGVGLGTFLASAFTGETDIVFEAFFDALAAGTFLYITTFDILPRAMNSQNSHWIQWLMAIIGFAMMAIIAIWA